MMTEKATGVMKDATMVHVAASSKQERSLDVEGALEVANGATRLLKKRKTAKAPVEATPRSWDDYFANLQIYKESHGSCLVPTVFQDDQDLSDWVQQQRTAEAGAKLTTTRRDLLLAIGFEWGEYNPALSKVLREDNTLFNLMLARVDAIRNNVGPGLAHSEIMKERDRAGWYKHQTWLRANEVIIPERLQKLESLDFFDLYDLEYQHEFNTKITQLSEFQQKHGHVNVGRSNAEKLLQWTNRQRALSKKGQLSEDNANRLIKLGVDLHMHDVASFRDQTNFEWSMYYEKLGLFHSQHSHVRVPRKNNFVSLANWVECQRDLWKLNILAKDRFERLGAMGFSWTETPKENRRKARRAKASTLKDDAPVDSNKENKGNLSKLLAGYGSSEDESQGPPEDDPNMKAAVEYDHVRDTSQRKVSNLPAYMTKTVVKTEAKPNALAMAGTATTVALMTNGKALKAAQARDSSVRKLSNLPAWMTRQIDAQLEEKEHASALKPQAQGHSDEEAPSEDFFCIDRAGYNEGEYLTEKGKGGGKVLPRKRGYQIHSSTDMRSPLSAINTNLVL